MKPENRRRKLYQILDISFKQFRTSGFAQTTVKDIAAACHISKPTLYKYVKTKDQILVLFHDLSFYDIESRVRSDLEAGDAEMALWRGLTGIHSTVTALGEEMFSRYIYHLLESDDDSYRFGTDLEELCTEALQQLQENGQVTSSASARDLYHILVHLDQGMIMDWCRHALPGDLTRRFAGIYQGLLQYSPSAGFDFPVTEIRRISEEDYLEL